MAKPQPKNKDSNNTIILALVGLVAIMIAVTAVNTWLLLDTRTTAQSALAASNPAAERIREPVFVKIEPFTVNLRSDQFGPRLLYTGMTLEVQDGDTRQTLLDNMPQVRSRLLVMLSGLDAENISTTEGKTELAERIKVRLSESYANSTAEIEIFEVLFTEFIVQ
ncbi:flagellar basal body-associated protein FliL [Aliidiomarina shirensis]|uniref:Flagellar protein FliL n=1 Tax=Aliidiomarina shirensis TaxID=1048642 RepID=A0A432WP62_9GAMM|nr:flagellar basal body-associated protein FliL [Aliidiomarina shirensis]RUO35592.1 flagellar basal body-associated protein FliL [Aliidiomarina shirensis]